MSYLAPLKWLIGIMVTVSVFCSGGGADVGNPFRGTVSVASPEGKKAAGAQVILARNGADPHYMSNSLENRVYCFDYSDEVGVCINQVFFDTVLTDDNGAFVFDDVPAGEYVVYVKYGDLAAIDSVRQEEGYSANVALSVAKTGVVKIERYNAVPDSGGLAFTGALISGTPLYATAGKSGDVVIEKVPAGTFAVIVYLSDSTDRKFMTLPVTSEKMTVLRAHPDLDEGYWTPVYPGARNPLDRPYVLDAYIPSVQQGEASALDSGKQFDLRITFSQPMNTVSLSNALTVSGGEDNISFGSVIWSGGSTVYLSLCLPDSLGECGSSFNSQFKKGSECTVQIDTTAESAQGVTFGFKEVIRFVPNP